MMKYHVRMAPGLDITEEDVDLLPWAHNRGNKKNLDNAEYHRLQGAELRAFAKKKRSESIDGEDEAAMAAAEAVRRADQEEALRLKAQAEAEAAAVADAAAEASAAAEAATLVEAARLQKEQEAAAAEAAAAKEEKERQQAEDATRLRKATEDAERLRKVAEESERRRREEEEAERERQRQAEATRRKQLPPAVTQGTSPIERAYYWYDLLEAPTRQNMKCTIDKTTGMDITQNDVDVLPWKADGNSLDYAKLHDLLEAATGQVPALKDETDACSPSNGGGAPSTPTGRRGIVPKSILSAVKSPTATSSPIKHVSFTPRSTKGTISPSSKKSSLWNALGEDERQKRKAFGWYLTLQRPSREVMTKIIAETEGIAVSTEDVDLLPWDESDQFVEEEHMVLPSLFGASDQERHERQVKVRRQEDKARAEEAAELVTWKNEQPEAPPVMQGHSDIEQAYQWYRKLGEPSKETMLAVLNETKGVDLTAEQLDTLPWTQHDKAIDYEQLEEGLKKGKETIDPRLLAALLKAYGWYEDLGIPKFITFSNIVENTEGVDVTLEDIAKLPWDEVKQTVDADKMRELQRLLEAYLLKLKEEKEGEARLKREAAAKARQQAARQKKDEEEAARRKAYADDEEKKPHQDMPLFLHHRMSLRELEFKEAKEKGDHKGWEESRALKAYAWYSRMTGPNRSKLKRIVASMKECDITPDDVDLLPWSPSGGWVDHIKIDELSRRRKKVIY
jgi:hypothetical protein